MSLMYVYWIVLVWYSYFELCIHKIDYGAAVGDPSQRKLRNSALIPMRDSQLVRYRRGTVRI